MDGLKSNNVGVGASVNREWRYREHDALEARIMDIVRPFTTNKHAPDRWVYFGGVKCPFDVKTKTTCEDNSHEEYQKLVNEGYPVWIAYQDAYHNPKNPGAIFAEWFDKLTWRGPFPPSDKSRSGDPYYTFSGGRPLADFLQAAGKEAQMRRKQ